MSDEQTADTSADRDSRGRFAVGHRRFGGRKPGNRNKLSEAVSWRLVQGVEAVGTEMLAASGRDRTWPVRKAGRRCVATRIAGRSLGECRAHP